jgi:hypothetical protein
MVYFRRAKSVLVNHQQFQVEQAGNTDVHILTNPGNVGLSTKVIVLSTGEVGIANANPTANLAVTGNVYVSTTHNCCRQHHWRQC